MKNSNRSIASSHIGTLVTYIYPDNDRAGTPQLVKREKPYDTYVYQPCTKHTEIVLTRGGRDVVQVLVAAWSNQEHTANPQSNELVLSQYNDKNVLVLSDYASYAPDSDEIVTLLAYLNEKTGETWSVDDLEQWRDKLYCEIPELVTADPSDFFYECVIEKNDKMHNIGWVDYDYLLAKKATDVVNIIDICAIDDFEFFGNDDDQVKRLNAA